MNVKVSIGDKRDQEQREDNEALKESQCGIYSYQLVLIGTKLDFAN